MKHTKDMTPQERAALRKQVLSAPVSSEEIKAFDPMIHKIIKNEILRYWGNGANVYSGDAIIGRLGMSFEDLMQYGRMLVMNQIRWFKVRGINPETGKPWNARMTTLIYQHLRNKFMSLSKSFASDRNGGQVVNVEDNRDALQNFVLDFNSQKNVDENLISLRAVLSKCSKDTQRRCNKQFKSNEEMLRFLRSVVSGMESVSHVCYEEIESFAAGHSMTPESSLLLAEEIRSRLVAYGQKRGLDSVTMEEYINSEKRTGTRRSFAQQKPTVLMDLAKRAGVSSQRKLAEKLGISATTLSNIMHGRSRGTPKFRDSLKQMFGKTLDELLCSEE